MNSLVTASARIYELLIYAYPRRFRVEYGNEMASVFAENCSHTYESSGLFALFALWLATVQDLIVSASVEHVAIFLSNARNDLLLVARAPAFASASGGLLGALFFIVAASVRISREHEPARAMQQFEPLAIATLSIAALWFAGVVAVHIMRSLSTQFRETPFAGHLEAFTRLAKISLIIALVSVLKYQVFDTRLSDLQWLPASHQWFAFPLILLATVSAVVLLDPLLTLRRLVARSSKSVGSKGAA